MKTWVKILALGVLAMSLGACGKKSKKSSTVATTPTSQNCLLNTSYSQYMYEGTTTTCTPPVSSCVYNPSTGQYTYSGTTTICSTGGTGGGTCVMGQYGYVNEFNQPCTPGGYNGTGGICGQYNNRPEWNYAYYVPMNLYGQMWCVRYDLVQQGYGSNFQYQGGQQYFGCQWGYDCGGYSSGGRSCVSIGGYRSGYDYGINGQLGFCF